MDKNKGIFHGAAGYDAVARKKIKELEGKVGGGSAGGGVSSWNDLTDKPFYKTTEKIEVPSQTVSFTNQGGMYMGMIHATLNGSPNVGDIVFVNWGGQKFNCPVLASTEGTTLIGNGALVGMGADNGIPFGMMMHPDIGMQFMTAESGASRVISIEYETVTYHTLDNQYLNIDQLDREISTFAHAGWCIGVTTKEEVKSFLDSVYGRKALHIDLYQETNPGSTEMMASFIVPHAFYYVETDDSYQSFDGVILIKDKRGSTKPELLIRVSLRFENGVFASYERQLKQSYVIIGEDYNSYEIKVNANGQVVATRIDG